MKFLKICLLIYLALSLILPVQLRAGEGLYQNTAKIEAERAADADVNEACWIGAGMTLIGVGIALMWQSSYPDPAAFVGKSPEYIRAYTDAYKSRVQKTQTLYSCIGCAFGFTIGCGIMLLVELNLAVSGCGNSSSSSSSCSDGTN
jgi:hypothetical protein